MKFFSLLVPSLFLLRVTFCLANTPKNDEEGDKSNVQVYYAEGEHLVMKAKDFTSVQETLLSLEKGTLDLNSTVMPTAKLKARIAKL